MSKQIIIPGMYRSGTSYLCKRLADVGYSAGALYDDYMEDATIHGAIIVEREKNPPNPKQIPFGYEPSKGMLRTLEAHKNMMGDEKYMVKDPSMAGMLVAFALTWPDAHYILCVRNPVSAIWSQRLRGHIHKEHTELDSLGHHNQLMVNILFVFQRMNLKHFIYNYDADQKREQEGLRLFLNEPDLDIASGFARSIQSREDLGWK